ncbi:MAG: hypothetical protein IJS19_01360 [Muribaculaceae bacterium]|nr:hypothetical protein [Muribaculaceae bacterium]
MKRIFFSLTLIVAATTVFSQSANDDFQTFRKGILNDYEGFRKSILDDYADFLEQAWKEFESFRGIERDPVPKPVKKPVAPAPSPEEKPVAQTPKPDVSPTVEPRPKPPVTPQPTVPITPQTMFRNMDFYGITLKVPKVDLSSVANLDANSFNTGWRRLANERISDKVVAPIRQIANTMQLPDWTTVELFRHYADTALPTASAYARLAFAHYLLCHAGFDCRLARSATQPLLLIPIVQTVYGQPYLIINKRNYVIYYDNINGNNDGDRSLYTCELPSDENNLGDVNLRITRPMLLPENDRDFKLTGADLTITGKVNKTMVKMLEHYPQMPIPEYARSTADSNLRKSVVDQLKKQLEGMDKIHAAQQLLSFCQYCFDYATDGDQFGYEKPFFFEENFFWPKNDCEDRSIFFTYLLRHVLDVDNVLLDYPGHESVALSIPGIERGDGFAYNRKRYFISDPTYVGAMIGQCMPRYKTTDPIVQEW